MSEGEEEGRVRTHSKEVLGELASLWSRQELCDVTLRADGVVHSAHRVVLAAASPYFQGMFLGSMRENCQDEIEIHGISKDIFSQLLQFIYEGYVCVTPENCQELLAGADMLQLSGLLQQCCDFLVQQLDPSNVLGIMLFAECHACSRVKKEAVSFVHKHFLQVTEEEEYLDLPEEHVVSLLQSEYLQIDSEFQVFTAALKWILHDIKARRKSVFAVCASVRFPIISYKQLDAYIANCKDLSLQIALQKLVADFKNPSPNSRLELKLKLKPYMFQPRRFARKCIYVTGGYSREPGQRWSESVTLPDVHRFSLFDQTWTLEAPMLEMRSSHGACVLNGKVYVVGGENQSLIFDTAEVLNPGDPSSGEGMWTSIACMTVPRCNLGVCAVDGAIYAIGGWIGSQIGATVEKYYPEEDTWRQWDKMVTPRLAMGIVENEGLIYLAGGTSDMGSDMDLLESYNPVTKEWLPLPCMRRKRGCPALGVLDNKLYVVGGWDDEIGALNSVERYDIDQMKWEWIEPVNVGRAGAMVASVNGCLYVMGGRKIESGHMGMPPASLSSVECYNPQTETWIEVGEMPISRCEAAVTVL